METKSSEKDKILIATMGESPEAVIAGLTKICMKYDANLENELKKSDDLEDKICEIKKSAHSIYKKIIIITTRNLIDTGNNVTSKYQYLTSLNEQFEFFYSNIGESQYEKDLNSNKEIIKNESEEVIYYILPFGDIDSKDKSMEKFKDIFLNVYNEFSKNYSLDLLISGGRKSMAFVMGKLICEKKLIFNNTYHINLIGITIESEKGRQKNFQITLVKNISGDENMVLVENI